MITFFSILPTLFAPFPSGSTHSHWHTTPPKSVRINLGVNFAAAAAAAAVSLKWTLSFLLWKHTHTQILQFFFWLLICMDKLRSHTNFPTSDTVLLSPLAKVETTYVSWRLLCPLLHTLHTCCCCNSLFLNLSFFLVSNSSNSRRS